MSCSSSDDENYEIPDLYEVTSDMIVAPGVYQTNAEKYHSSCNCHDFEANRVRPSDDFLFENIDQGEFPDWLKIHDPEVAVFDAMCQAKPKNYVNHSPVEAYCPFAEDECTLDDEFWRRADGSIGPLENLPFESLVTMLNTFQFPASHTGMESVLFWMKIYARYWLSYGFCLLRVDEKKEFEMLRREILDPNEVWMLPYWCLWNVREGHWCRHMLLVVRNTRRFVEKWEDLDTKIIGNAFEFLRAIASVSVSAGTNRFVAHPMIPHALKWMCILMPDCYEEYIRTYEDVFYTVSDRGISCCRLTIDDRIDVFHPVPKNEMAKRMTGKPFVFGEGRCYFVVTREPMPFEGMLFSVTKQQQAFLNCMEPLDARIRELKASIREVNEKLEKEKLEASIRKLKQENETLKVSIQEFKQENRRLKASIRESKQEKEKFEKETRLRSLKTPTQSVRRSLRHR